MVQGGYQEIGVYAYRDVYDSLTTLTFNDDGTLASMIIRHSSGVRQTEYSYKTITIKASDFSPTVYSNPTGVTVSGKPQLTEDEKLALVQ